MTLNRLAMTYDLAMNGSLSLLGSMGLLFKTESQKMGDGNQTTAQIFYHLLPVGPSAQH